MALPGEGEQKIEAKVPTSVAELFGHLAIQLGYVTRQQLEECLGEQQKIAPGQTTRLGQIMLRRRFLTTEQFLEILRQQERYFIRCALCSTKHFAGDVHDLRCTKCGGQLPKPSLIDEMKKTPFPVPRATPTPTPRPIIPPSASPLAAATPTIRQETPRPERLFGKYRLLDQISRGRRGSLWRAQDVNLNRKVALKMLRPQDVTEEGQVARFLKEARTAARLSHPNIVTIHEVGTINDTHYFTMEYVENTSMEKLLAQKKLTREQILQAMEKVARAVDYAHAQGVIHRNLKPNNILLDDRLEPHVTDFGMVTGKDAGGWLDSNKSALEAPYYLSPEQITGQGEVDRAGDLFSLGAVFYQALTGQVPFSGDSAKEIAQKIAKEEPRRPRAIDPTLPQELENIAMKALEKDPKQRYQTARELADEVKRFIEGQPIQARKVSSIVKLTRRARRHKSLATFCILVLLGAGGGGFWVWKKVKAEREEKERLERDRKRSEANAPYTDANEAFEKLLKNSSMASDDLKRVIEKCSEAIQIDESWEKAYRLRAKAYQALGHLGKAEADYAKAIEKLPADVLEKDAGLVRVERAHLYLHMAQLLAGRPFLALGIWGEPVAGPAQEPSIVEEFRKKAKADLDEAKARDLPQEESAWIAVLEAFSERKWSDCLKRCGLLQRKDVSLAALARLRGVSEYALGKFEEAFAQFGALAGLPSNPSEPRQIFATSLYSKAELEWAAETLSQAIQGASVDERLLLARGAVYHALKRWGDAEADFTRVSQDGEKTLRLAVLALSRGKPEEVKRLLETATAPEAVLVRTLATIEEMPPEMLASESEKILKDWPKHPTALFLRSWARLLAGEVDKARDDASAVITLVKTFGPAYVVRAEARRIRRTLRDALEDATRATEWIPEWWQSWLYQGECFLENKNYPLAEKSYVEALTLKPKEMRCRYGLARARAEQSQKYDQALEDFENLLREKTPPAFQADLRLRRSAVYEKKHHFEKAIAELKEALKIQPENGELLEKLGDYYGLDIPGAGAPIPGISGHFEKAVEAWERALRANTVRRAELEKKIDRFQPADWGRCFALANLAIGRGQGRKEYPLGKKYYLMGMMLLPLGGPRTPEDKRTVSTAAYNLACTIAVEAGQAESVEKHAAIGDAVSWLSKAIEYGFGETICPANCPFGPGHKDGWGHMEVDTDLEALHGDPRFEALKREN